MPFIFLPQTIAPQPDAFYESPWIMERQGGDWMTLGQITVFGQTDSDSRKLPARQIDIKFPVDTLPPMDPDKPHIDWNGWSIELNEWGNLGRLYKGKGGWDEFKTLYTDAEKRIAEGKANVWKVKAVIFRRTDVLYQGADSVFQRQYAEMSDADVQFCLETFARFEAAVEAFTGGAVDIQLTASVEDEPVLGSYAKDEVWSFHPFDAGENYLRGRFNRGDFDSILYMYHPATTRSYSFGGTIGRTNNATQSYVILSNGRELGTRIGHTEAMVHEWYHQIEDTYGKYGYGGWDYSWLPALHSAEVNGYTTDQAAYTGWFSWLKDLMRSSVRDGMWAKLSNRKEPDYAEARKQTHPSTGELYRWNDVRDDPWAELPFLTPADLAKRTGATSFSIQADAAQVLFLPTGLTPRTQILREIHADDYSLNNELNFSREAVARIGYNDRDLLFVRFDVADAIVDLLADHPAGTAPPANVLGYIDIDSRHMVVLDTRLANDSRSELNILNLGSKTSGIAVLGAANFAPTEPVKVAFSAEAPDARFSVTDSNGVGIPLNNGTLDLPAGMGAKILKVIAAMPSGERVERPFVVRRTFPVQMTLSAVGSRRISSTTANISLKLAGAGTIKLTPHLPSGWTISGVPSSVDLGTGGQKTIDATLTLPDSAPDGHYEIAMEGVTDATETVRLPLEKFTGDTLVDDTFDQSPGGWAAERPDRSGWSVGQDPGGVSGSCLVVKDRGGARWGRVNAFGAYLPDGKPDPAFMGYSTDAYPFLDFSLRSAFEDNLALSVTLSDGKRYIVMLAGPYQEQWGESKELPRAKFIPNGEWQRIVYNLDAALDKVAGTGPHFVTDIGFGDSRTFSSNQFYDSDVHAHYVDQFRITRSANEADNTVKEDPDAEISAGADPASTRYQDRARAAAAISEGSSPEQVAAIVPLISDPHPTVRMNAAAAFGKVKAPAAVAPLATAARLERQSYPGIFMIRALAFQDAPESWEAMKGIVRQGRAEEMAIGEAALAMGRKGDPSLADDISVALTAHSWIARRDGALGLAMLPGDVPQQLLMMFLMEVDPMVRIAVAQGANPDVDPVGRRMEWGSINDLSNIARAYDYASMTRSSDPVRRSRGYAGLKEADTDIRRIIAEEMGNDPKEYHVQPLLGLLSDTSPEVRAAALQSLLKMPGDRNFSEMTVLAGEDYEEVLTPLLQAAKDKKITLPQAMLERLAAHRNADIRKLVKEITG